MDTVIQSTMARHVQGGEKDGPQMIFISNVNRHALYQIGPLDYISFRTYNISTVIRYIGLYASIANSGCLKQLLRPYT